MEQYHLQLQVLSRRTNAESANCITITILVHITFLYPSQWEMIHSAYHCVPSQALLSRSPLYVEPSHGYSVPYIIPEGDTSKTKIYDRELAYVQRVKLYQTTHLDNWSTPSSAMTSNIKYKDTLFKQANLTPICGKPTSKTLHKLRNEIKSNAKAVY